KARKLRGANTIHHPLEGAGLSYRSIVETLSSGKFHGEKQPLIGAEFVYALTQLLPGGVNKNVPASRVQRKCHTADFGVMQRLAPPAPKNGGFCPRRRSNRIRRAVRIAIRAVLESVLVKRRKEGRRQVEDGRAALSIGAG